MIKFVWLSTLFFVIASASLSQNVEDVLRKAYSNGAQFSDAEIRDVEALPFADEAERVMTLVQIYSLGENPDDLEKAIVIAKNFLSNSGPGWEAGFVQTQLSIVLQLVGRPAEGITHAEELLNSGGFGDLMSKADNRVLRALRKTNAIGGSNMGEYMEDELKRMIGFYYLNRSPVEGGVDVHRAVSYLNSIKNVGLKSECLQDARLKEIVNASAPSSDRGLPIPNPQNVESGEKSTQLAKGILSAAPTVSEVANYNAGKPVWGKFALTGTIVLALALGATFWRLYADRKDRHQRKRG